MTGLGINEGTSLQGGSYENADIHMYKEHLSLLIARGKTKELIGKNITLTDLDKMSPKDLEKYYKLYETAQAAKINQAVTNAAINTYTGLCKYLFNANKQQIEKLNTDLKNDFLVTNEIEQWASFLSFKIGGLLPLISASLITFENLKPSAESTQHNSIETNENSSNINDGCGDCTDKNGVTSTSTSTSTSTNTSTGTSDEKTKVTKTNSTFKTTW